MVLTEHTQVFFGAAADSDVSPNARIRYLTLFRNYVNSLDTRFKILPSSHQRSLQKFPDVTFCSEMDICSVLRKR